MQNAPEQEQLESLEMISGRFQKVIIYTVLENLTEEQKQKFSEALQNQETVEESIAELTSEVPGLSEAIEQGLLGEYEALKTALTA